MGSQFHQQVIEETLSASAQQLAKVGAWCLMDNASKLLSSVSAKTFNLEELASA